MTPDERQILNNIANTVAENNKMLHSMRRSMRRATVARWIYWIIIIGVSVGAFWVLQPYMDSLMKTYSQIQAQSSSFQNILTTPK